MGKGDTHIKKYSKTKFIKYDLELAKKDEGEFYAKVLGVLSGNRIRVKDIKGEEFQVIIRGNFFYGAKKENINFLDPERNDYWILVQIGISKGQYFLKHIYNDSDKQTLYDRGELTNVSTQNNTLQINNEKDVDMTNINNDDWLDNL
jgi:hypothetical protein